MTGWLAFAFALSLVGTAAMRRYALARGVIDVPNERSSHVVPTPRGGGVAFVVAITICAIAVVTASRDADLLGWVAWLVGGIVVAAAGFVDDRCGLQPSVRLVAHAAAALPVVACTGLPISVAGHEYGIGWVGVVVAWCAVVWSVNAFNFMDGTDGIAAAQATFVFASAGVLAAVSGATQSSVLVLGICAAGAAGFLAWNLPPARIFMGDAGSGFLGFAVAALALLTAAAAGPTVWVWMILHALFVADATVTLSVRALRGRKLHVAHRSHAYQRLSRRWGSHARVLGAYAGVNVFVLLPVAVIAHAHPSHAPALAFVVLAGASVAAVLLGAGRDD
jgi:Fuc2NAc and GlcNAc transferase